MIFENFQDDTKENETISQEDKQLLKDVVDEIVIQAVKMRESSTYGEFATLGEALGVFIDTMDEVGSRDGVTNQNFIAEVKKELAK